MSGVACVQEMAFKDGDPPPQHVLDAWLDLCDRVFSKKKSKVDSESKSAPSIAVHCVAGLGRYVPVARAWFCRSGTFPDPLPLTRAEHRCLCACASLKPAWLLWRPLSLCASTGAWQCACCVCTRVANGVNTATVRVSQPRRHQYAPADVREQLPQAVQWLLLHPVNHGNAPYGEMMLGVLAWLLGAILSLLAEQHYFGALRRPVRLSAPFLFLFAPTTRRAVLVFHRRGPDCPATARCSDAGTDIACLATTARDSRRRLLAPRRCTSPPTRALWPRTRLYGRLLHGCVSQRHLQRLEREAAV